MQHHSWRSFPDSEHDVSREGLSIECTNDEPALCGTVKSLERHHPKRPLMTSAEFNHEIGLHRSGLDRFNFQSQRLRHT